jgi:hypothetical protein
MLSKFDSVDSIVDYLRQPSRSSEVATIPLLMNTNIINNELKSSKKQQKENDLANVMSATPPPPQVQVGGDIQISPKGRVR